jgi:photosystem II stability/assembly factor-like uncharacterized protein
MTRSLPLFVVALIAACANPASQTSSSTLLPTAAATPISTPPPTPTSSPAPSASRAPIALPTFAQVAAAGRGVVWMLVQAERLFRSVDRGDIWTERSLPPQGASEIAFVSDLEGWAMAPASPATQCQAESVTLWHTSDGASTWQKLAISGIAEADCKGPLAFNSSARGYLDSWSPNAAPKIYRTTDGGGSWAASVALPDPPGFTSSGAGFELRAGQVADFGSSLFVDAGGLTNGELRAYVFRSTNGGATWSYVSGPPSSSAPVVFITPLRWIQLITTGQSQETTDGGATWHLLSSDYAQAAPVAPQVEFGDANTGYATVRGALARTTDGGAHWTALRTPGTAVP